MADRIGVCLILSALTSLAICTPGRASEVRLQKQATSLRSAQLNRLMMPLLKKTNGALVIGFTDGRKHQFFSYGIKSDLERTRPDKNTIFEVGSLTKVFTSLLFVDLWQANKLSFDDPVAKFTPPDSHVPDYGGKQITLFQLATHTSGMPRDPDNFPSQSQAYGDHEFHAFLRRCRLLTPPGKKYLYSNAGFTLLGEALESAGQAPYWHLLKDRILDPLKMSDTMIVLDQGRLARLAQGHGKYGQILANSPSTGGPSGGLKSTASDLVKLLDAALQQDNSRIATDIAESCKRKFRLNRSESACPGWFYKADRDSYYKSGQVDGFSVCLEFSPSRRRGLVVLSATLELEAEPILKNCAALCK
jgi:serine-type D-Ala-D-Ala carboxypeptidase/endopeptidase